MLIECILSQNHFIDLFVYINKELGLREAKTINLSKVSIMLSPVCRYSGLCFSQGEFAYRFLKFHQVKWFGYKRICVAGFYYFF
jgi:hypothetical protein